MSINHSSLQMCAPCLFGLESILSGELKRLGGEQVTAADGRVSFSGDFALLAKANLWLRTAERVCIVLGTFEARSFTELFDQVTELPFEQFIGKQDAFPVAGWSLKSALHSIPDCQSIIKKAAVKRLEKVYGLSWFEESGPVHQIRFSIHKDTVTLMLDTSGVGLHKRGYRQIATEAPLKETLAAGIADLAHTRRDGVTIDPMCGSGTLLIESALRAFNIAPGLQRRFAAENWGAIPADVWKNVRAEARGLVRRDAAFRGLGYDIDALAIGLTGENSEKAGVKGKIVSSMADIADFRAPEGDFTLLCNPPYGERLLEIKEAEALYRTLGKVIPDRPGASAYIISPHEEFERLFGRRAKKRRKLYNGMIKCQLFMYYS